MKYHLHDNGWTVILDEFDFRTATQDDINQIAKLLATHTCVVARGQQLSVTDELRIFNMFKDPYSFQPDTNPNDHYVKGCVLPESDGYILRVTSKLDEDGLPGFAPKDADAIWHCDNPTRAIRKDITWLYSAAGSIGSKTSWMNNALSYADLDKTVKDLLIPLSCRMCHYTDKEPTEWDYQPKLVHTNIAGIPGLYFPFESILNFIDMSEKESKEIINFLISHVTQEKYLYHHDWVDGDVVLGEQWLGIHQRWPMPNTVDKASRMLHRAIFNFPEQDYS